MHDVPDEIDQPKAQGKAVEPQAKKDGEATSVTTAPVDAKAKPAEDYQAMLAERDKRIAELEEQVSQATKSAETAEELRAQIAELKQRGEDERVEYGLMLAGCRNVKAAKGVLADRDGDISALREAEPWLFTGVPAQGKGKRPPERRHRQRRRRPDQALARARGARLRPTPLSAPKPRER